MSNTKDINLPTFFKVECIYDGWEAVDRWRRLLEKMFGRNTVDPQKNCIYTVVKYHGGYYELDEFPGEDYRVEGFIPVQENFQSISLEKVLEQETKLISVN